MACEASSAACTIPPAVLASYSSVSVDSYNGDNTRHFLRQLNKTRDLYSEATYHAGHLNSYLEATQAALSAIEGETSAAREMLAAAAARVAGRVSF